MQVSHGATHGMIILIFILGDYLDSASRLLLAEYIAKSRFNVDLLEGFRYHNGSLYSVRCTPYLTQHIGYTVYPYW